MRRPAPEATRSRAPGLGAELFLVGLVHACLAGALALVVATHRKHARPKPVPVPALVTRPAPPPRPKPKPAPPPPEEPEPPPPGDPTPKELARLAGLEAEQRAEADRLDRRAAALDQARAGAIT